MTSIGPDHYRYEATLDPDGVNIECRTYVVIAETPKCYWVIRKSLSYLAEKHPNSDTIKRQRKLILKEKGGRRHCYPDRKDALNSLLIRKKRQLMHIERSISVANLAIKGIKDALESGADLSKELKCGQDDYTSSLNWDY